MKTILKLPLSTVKVITAIAILLIGILVALTGIIVYTDYKALFGKKKSSATES